MKSATQLFAAIVLGQRKRQSVIKATVSLTLIYNKCNKTITSHFPKKEVSIAC